MGNIFVNQYIFDSILTYRNETVAVYEYIRTAIR